MAVKPRSVYRVVAITVAFCGLAYALSRVDWNEPPAGGRRTQSVATYAPEAADTDEDYGSRVGAAMGRRPAPVLTADGAGNRFGSGADASGQQIAADSSHTKTNEFPPAVWGTCTDSSVPSGFPLLYSRCGYLLTVGETTTLITTQDGAEITTSGADEGKISKGGEPVETGQIAFIGDPGFEGDARRFQTNGIVTQRVNYVQLILPHPSPTFANQPSGDAYSSTFRATGSCTWDDPYIQSTLIQCQARTMVGRFRFTFKQALVTREALGFAAGGQVGEARTAGPVKMPASAAFVPPHRLDPSPSAAALTARYPWTVKAQSDLTARECAAAALHDRNYWWSKGKCHMKFIRYAAGVALRDTHALEDQSSVRRKGELLSPTQYRPDEDAYCEHGGYCYPARDIKLLGSIRTAPDAGYPTGEADPYQEVTTSCELLEEDRVNIVAADAQELFRGCR